MSLPYVGTELTIFAEAIRWKAYYKDFIKPHIGQKVLEVGAGLGATTSILCDGSEKEWWCLEPDVQLLTEVEDKIHSGNLPACCRAIGGKVTDLPKKPQFQSLLYIDVLEHIEDDKGELEAAASILFPGGCLIVLAPAYPALYSPFDRSIGHLRRYTRASLLALAPAQMTSLKVHYLDSMGVCLSLANRWLLRQPTPTRRQILFWDRFLVPLTRPLDWLVNYSFGRSILAIWQKN